MLFSTAAVAQPHAFKLEKTQTRRNLTNVNPKKSPIHENPKITCDFGDDRCRIASARLEKDIICEDSFAYVSYSSKDV